MSFIQSKGRLVQLVGAFVHIVVHCVVALPRSSNGRAVQDELAILFMQNLSARGVAGARVPERSAGAPDKARAAKTPQE
jgi:hypothetical protein